MDKETFIILRDKLLQQLITDKKVIFDNNKNKYKLRTTAKYILKNYECCSLLVECCQTQTFNELKYCLFNKNTPFEHVCPICGKQSKFNGVQYNVTCRDKKCLCELLLQNDKISHMHDLIKQNYLNGNKEFKPVEIGYIEKHHVLFGSQVEGWHDKLVNTWKKWTPEQKENRKKKLIATCRQKYGCDFSQQNPDIKKKQIDTWNNKTEEELKTKNQKRQITTIARYGVDHIMKSQTVLENVKQRHFKENGYYHWIQKNIEHKDIYFDDNRFKEYVIGEFKNNNNTRIKKSILDKFFNVNVLARCKELHLMKYIEVFTSKLEEKFKNLFTENNIAYSWRNRRIVDGPNGKSHCYELDFFLPDYNIAIEINDISTHNSIYRSTQPYGINYHVYKTQNCKEKGIRLIHIWEWEIQKDFDKVSKWLLNVLNSNKDRVFARKCELKLVAKNEEKQFLTNYHLQGYQKSDLCLGLYYNNELVQLMSFSKPRFSNKYQYELLRLCSKYNINIIGGANKLFKHFIKNYAPTSIISYCDYSKFTGAVYEQIGMKFVKLTKPNIVYCNYEMDVVNESILMKYGIDKLLKTNYGKGTNNRELIMKHGYLPIHNCGNIVYDWHKTI